MLRIRTDNARGTPIERARIEEAAMCLREGGIVCFPTDTAYGLAVDPFQPAAVESLFQLKGRREDKPILLLVASWAMVRSVAEPPEDFADFARRFWPGPITAILPARKTVSTRITAASGTVGVRWPDAAIPLRLIEAFGGPVTATSANRSGHPIASTVDEAVEQFASVTRARLTAAIDDGPRTRTATSTIIDMTVEPRVVVREGPVDFARLQAFLGNRVRRAAG